MYSILTYFTPTKNIHNNKNVKLLEEYQKKSLESDDFKNKKILINLIKIYFKPICMVYVWL